MPVVYVARSTGACDWGASVGLTKHIYKVGVAEDSAEAAVKELNAASHAGQNDWKLVKKESVEGVDEATAMDRLSQKEKMVDPALYPKIKGVRGIYKVKPVNVENHLFVKQALENLETRDIKIKPADFATYLIHNATR